MDAPSETNGPLRLAVDAMGGDEAPEEVVAAVAEASTETRASQPVYFTLVGDESRVTDHLMQFGHNPERIQIRHAAGVVDPSGPAETGLRETDGASVEVACELVAEGRADAVVSAGHPGAALLAATRHFDRVPGVDRAPLCAVFPTPRRSDTEETRLSLLLDVGASHSADAGDLVNYAVMGSAYAKLVGAFEEPRVALLSTSASAGAGPPAVAEAADRLADDSRVFFRGTCEGHEVPGGVADVIVCNGYVGNVTLKLLEGVSEAAVDLARSAYDERFLWRVGLRLLQDGLNHLKQITDFEEYGGAPVLGLEEVLIVAHARSRRKAFGNALRLALKNVKADLPGRIAEAVSDEDAA